MGEMIKHLSEIESAIWAIGVTGLFALGISIERARAFYLKYNLKSDTFMKQLNSLLYADQIEEAIAFCDANKQRPMAHIIKAVLERADRDEESMKKGFEIAFIEVMPNLTKRLGYIALCSNLATLIGLLGTVHGLIMGFSAVAGADPSQRQSLLSSAISLAMNATMMGLLVAIPFLVVFAVLSAKKDSLLTDCAENGSKVLDILTSRIYRETEAEAKKAA